MSVQPTNSFISEFLEWRDKKVHNDAPSFDIKYFDINFLSNNKYMDIKKASDELLGMVLNHYQSDEGINLIDISRPDLTEDLAEFVGDDKSKEIYQKYGKLILLQTLYQAHRQSEKKIPCKINHYRVEKDLKDITGDPKLTLDTMKFTYLAIKSQAPEMLPFIGKHRNYVCILVKKKLLDDEYMQKWIQKGIDYQNEHQDDDEYDSLRFNDLKFKLDLLDPTFALSNEILSKYYTAQFVFHAATNFKETPMFKRICSEAMIRAIAEIERGDDQTLLSYVKQLKAIYGPSLFAFYSKFSQAMCHHQLSGYNVLHTYDVNHVFCLDDIILNNKLVDGIPDSTDGNLYNETKKGFLASLQADKNFYRFANSLLVCCHAAVLFYGINNWDSFSGVEKGIFVGSTFMSIIDVFNAFDNKLFIKIGEKLEPILFKYKTTTIGLKINAFKEKFMIKSPKITKYIVVFIVLSIFMTAYDIFETVDQKQKNWGWLLALNIGELMAEFAELTVILVQILTFTTWAGPLGMIATGVLMAIGLAKALFSYFNDLINGHAEEKFLKSVESDYLLTETAYMILGYLYDMKEYKDSSDPLNNCKYLLAQSSLQKYFMGILDKFVLPPDMPELKN